jgi:hypothetical protein
LSSPNGHPQATRGIVATQETAADAAVPGVRQRRGDPREHVPTIHDRVVFLCGLLSRVERAEGEVTLEHPDVVLIAATAANLFRPSKSASLIEELVTEGHRPLSVPAPRLAGHDQSVSIPVETREHSLPSDLFSIREALSGMLNGLIAGNHPQLEAKDRVAVFNAQDAALKRSGAGTERAPLPVQDPLT